MRAPPIRIAAHTKPAHPAIGRKTGLALQAFGLGLQALLCTVWQRKRRLAKNITPAGRLPNVGVAEPLVVVNLLPILETFYPELRGDHGSVTPYSHHPIGVDLMLVLSITARRILQ